MTSSTPANTISIPHVSKLANIPLSSDETGYFEKSFGPVIEYMQKIGELDIENVLETTRTSEEENVVREDIVMPSLPQEAALRNAKNSHEGFFIVSAILEKRE